MVGFKLHRPRFAFYGEIARIETKSSFIQEQPAGIVFRHAPLMHIPDANIFTRGEHLQKLDLDCSYMSDLPAFI